jgi:hypothetical protein
LRSIFDKIIISMKRFLYVFVLAALVANVFTYCIKPPDYPIEPVITFSSVSPNTILQQPFFRMADTVYTDLLFSFTDGDGDLGFDDGTVSVIIKDTRLPSIPLNYLLPKVDPQGAGNGISGTARIRVQVSCCIPDPINGIPLPACDTLPTSSQLRDTVIYSIQIKDRAGNLSNIIETTPITLICKRQ